MRGNRVAVPHVKSSLAVFCLSMVLSASGHADTAPPGFGQYPAGPQARGKPAQPDLASHPLARRFRSVLRNGAKKGPNFAGHYALVTWGCGTACLRFALVDSVSGRVHFPEEIEAVFATLPPGEGEPGTPLRFRRDSRLLEIEGYVGDAEGRFYYLLDGGELRPLCAIAKGARDCFPASGK